MAVCNNDLVQVEHETEFALDEVERNFMNVTEIAVLLESPNVSINDGVSNKCGNAFGSKNGYSNGQETFNQKSLREVDTNITLESDLCGKNSEENFTISPKRRINLQERNAAKERISGAGGIVSECSVYPEINTEVVQSENHHKYNTEPKMEYTFIESFYKYPEENPSSSGSLFENNDISSSSNTIARTQTLVSNSKVNVDVGKHILDLPDLVLEHIMSYVNLKDLSHNVRAACRTFYILSSRILRLAFKNIHVKLCTTLQQLENQHRSNWNPVCAEVLTCKLLQSEMETLRAACSRQIETGHYCFIYGDVLQEYRNILHIVRDRKISGMLNGFSDTLIRLNEKPLKYWDNRYDDEDMPLGEIKLFGIEIIEVLLSALNASGCIVVTYQPSLTFGSNNDDTQGEVASGSCVMVGCVSINQSTQLKAPAMDHLSIMAKRRTVLRYIRALVRTNNCDIVLHKLRACSKEKHFGAASLPVFEHRAWTLCHSEVVHHNMVQQSYMKYPIINYLSTSVPDCNMQVICSFEMVCPKRANPFGIALDSLYQSLLASEILTTEEEDIHGSSLAETLCGDHYSFKMDFRTCTPGSNDKHNIEIVNYFTKTNKWFLTINTKATSENSSL